MYTSNILGELDHSLLEPKKNSMIGTCAFRVVKFEWAAMVIHPVGIQYTHVSATHQGVSCRAYQMKSNGTDYEICKPCLYMLFMGMFNGLFLGLPHQSIINNIDGISGYPSSISSK